MRIISIFVLSVLIGCGKGNETQNAQKAAPDTTSTSSPADTAPTSPETHDVSATTANETHDANAAPPPEPRAVAPLFEAWSSGKIEEAFAAVADDATWHVVGHPETPVLRGRSALVTFEKARHASLTELSMTVKRILTTPDAQVIEYVWTAQVGVRGAEGEDTKRDVTAPAALVLVYDRADKIIEGWSFQNDALILQLAGAMAGPPEGFVPFAKPDALEAANGDTDPKVIEAWKAFSERLTPSRLGELAELFADDFRGTTARSGAPLDKAAMLVALEQRVRGLGEPTRMTVRDFAVGEYHASISTTAGAYLGGLGPDPKGQRIEWTTLDVVRIAQGKLTSSSTYLNDLQPLAALGLLGTATPAPETGSDSGVPACDRFMRAMKACLESMPEAARKPQQDNLDKLTASWKSMTDKTALDSYCKTLIDNSRPSLEKVCPDVKWD